MNRNGIEPFGLLSVAENLDNSSDPLLLSRDATFIIPPEYTRSEPDFRALRRALRAVAGLSPHEADKEGTAAKFRGETVIHHVELSLFPNWVGVEQERLVEIRDDRMTLSTRPMLFGGMQRSAHLIWERV